MLVLLVWDGNEVVVVVLVVADDVGNAGDTEVVAVVLLDYYWTVGDYHSLGFVCFFPIVTFDDS